MALEKGTDAVFGGKAPGQLVLQPHRRFEGVQAILRREEHLRQVAQRRHAEGVGVFQLGPQRGDQDVGRPGEILRQVPAQRLGHMPAAGDQLQLVQPRAGVGGEAAAVESGMDRGDLLGQTAHDPGIEEVLERFGHGGPLGLPASLTETGRNFPAPPSTITKCEDLRLSLERAPPHPALSPTKRGGEGVRKMPSSGPLAHAAGERDRVRGLRLRVVWGQVALFTSRRPARPSMVDSWSQVHTPARRPTRGPRASRGVGDNRCCWSGWWPRRC